MRAPPRNAKAPTEVLADQGRGCKDVTSTDDATALTPKRKLKSVWHEGGQLYRYGPNGSTVFDTSKGATNSFQRRVAP